MDTIYGITPTTHYVQLFQRRRQHGSYRQAVVAGTYAEYILCGAKPVPCGRSGQPGILALAGHRGIAAGKHLRIDIRFDLVPTLILYPCRSYFSVMFPGILGAASQSFGYYHPRIIVAEDSRILLVAGRIRGNLAHLLMPHCESRPVQHHAVGGIKPTLARVERFIDHSGLASYTCHGTPALTFDKDLALVALRRTDFVSGKIVGAQEPFSIPAIGHYGMFHIGDKLFNPFRFIVKTYMAAKLSIFASFDHKKPGNHQRLGLRTFRSVFRRLITLIRIRRETVEVQAVVPVRTPYQRQTVRTQICNNMIERHLQVLHQRHFAARTVVPRHKLVKNREITRFLYIRHSPENQP